MNTNTAIRSAEIIAAVRAHGSSDKDVQNPDFMAKSFLGIKTTLFLWYLKLFRISKSVFERSSPGFYWYFQARTKHIDGIISKSIQSGIDQLIILGSGYDSRPYRFREKLEGIRIFEIDFPGTLTRKKQRLIKIFGSLPEHVIYVPIDFKSQQIKDVLFKNGYDPKKRSFFIWEGVSMYLPEESMNDVLEFIAYESGKNSSVIFDYALKSFIEGDYSTYGSKILAKNWEKIGEPGLSGIEDGQTERFLKKRGLDLIHDLGPEDLEHMYLTDSQGKQLGRVYGCLRIAYASVNNKIAQPAAVADRG